MDDVFIRFESEGREGIVAAGTYLMDAALRLGVDVNDDCREGAEEHHCSMKVSGGGELLSAPTNLETVTLSETARKAGERLSCQVKIEKAGEITIMSVERPSEEKEQAKKEEPGKAEEFKREFESMPLDEKFASLVELEAMALGETFSYVFNSPFEAAGKVVDVLAHFGWKKDKADHEAKKPEEHKKEEKKAKAPASEAKAKPSKKKSGSKAKETKKGE